VLAAVFPALRTSTFFSFLINRQVVIILCTALVSYPLSLYRDITKLAKASALALVSMVIIVYTVVSEGPNVPAEYRGTKVRLIPSGFGVFQAIGVISFGNLALFLVMKLTRSLCVSPQLATDLRRFEETHH
jgi:sodium-coupled neutral amino acid transporter 11